jgi:hypothetical protein
MDVGEYAGNYSNVTEDSIFAFITYSVKPNGSLGKQIWDKNGTTEGDWVIGRKSYIHIKKTDKGYVIDGNGYGIKW